MQALFVYIAVASALHLLWELLHLPLYTIWTSSPIRDSIAAALHCTLGDALIATWTVLVPLVALGRRWPNKNFVGVATVTIVVAAGYTIYSEWWNVEVAGGGRIHN